MLYAPDGKEVNVKKRLILLTICVLSVLMLAGVLTACNNNEVPIKFDVVVEFNYNISEIKMPGAEINSNYLGVNYGGLIQIRPMDNGTDSGFDLTVDRVNDYIMPDKSAWYLPLLDSEGNIQRDADGFVMLDRPWDFKNERVREDNPYLRINEDGKPMITLYAKYEKGYSVTYVRKDADGTETELNPYGGIAYYLTGTTISHPTSSDGASCKGWTFIGDYYSKLVYTADGEVDENNSVLFWKNEVDNNGNEIDGRYESYTLGNEDVKIYVHMLEGVYRIATKPTDLMYLNDMNVYVDADLDMAEVEWTPFVVNHKLVGNGHTISNITINLAPSSKKLGTEDYYMGLFSVLQPGADISDITFSNVQINFTYSSLTPINTILASFAGTAEDGAKVRNVSIDATLTEQDRGEKMPVQISQTGIADDKTSNKGDISFTENKFVTNR